MSAVGGGGGALLLVGVATFFGGRLFLVAVLVLAGVSLLETSRALEAAGPRPVVLAAAVAALGVPLRASLRPDDGLAALPALVVAMVLSAFVLLILTGRRHNATAALGATMLSGLVVGLGAGALVLMESEAGGWRWVIGLLVAAVVAVAGADAVTPRELPGSRSLRMFAAVFAAAPPLYLLLVALSS